MKRWRRDLPVCDRAVLGSLDRIERALKQILTVEGVQLMWIDDMRDAVAGNTTVTQGGVVAINKLADKVQELINAGADPAELQSFVDTLRTNDAALAAAIAAKTPAEAEPDPVPVEPEVLPEE